MLGRPPARLPARRRRQPLTQVAQANQDFLPPWQGGLVLAAYGLLLAAAGTLLTTRRDIT
jgi:ABC-2 type transport system permease protein